MNGTRLASHILRIFWTEGGTIRLHLLFRAQSLLSYWLASPHHAFSPPLSTIFATCSVLNCQQTSFPEVHLPTKLEVGVTHSKALFSFSPLIVGPCDSPLFQIGRLRQDCLRLCRSCPVDNNNLSKKRIVPLVGRSSLTSTDHSSTVLHVSKPKRSSKLLNFGASCKLHFSAN